MATTLQHSAKPLENTRPWLPYVLIIAGFAVLSLLFCYPTLQGKVLNQHDNLSWQGSAREGMAYHDSTGINTLWSNSMFGGMPTYTFYVPETKNLLVPVYDVVTHLLPKPANFFILAMLSFFVLMQVLRINRWVGALVAVAFAFASYNPIIIVAGHETKMYAIAFMPLVLAGVVLLFRGRYLYGAALTAAAFALECTTSHYQIVYYLGIVLMAALIGLFIQAVMEKNIVKGVIAGALAGLCMLVGVSSIMSILLPTQEYSKETMRGGASEVTFLHDKTKTGGGLDKEYAFRWSSGIAEQFCALVPFLYGGASGEGADKMPETYAAVNEQSESLPGYWGDQPFLSGPVYLGAIICFLFLFGLLIIRSPHKWWILAACAVGFIMSCGKNLPGINYWLFDHLPMLNKFRTPSMILVIPEFLFPVLAAWALHDVITNKTDRDAMIKKLWMAAGITGGLALILGVGGSLFFDFTNKAADANYGQLIDALKTDRAAMARNSGLLSAFYIAASAGLIWLFLKDRINQTMLLAGVAALIAIDMIPVAHRYLKEDNYTEKDAYADYFNPREADKQIAMDRDPYFRVFDLSRFNEVTGQARDAFNDSWSSYHHKSVGGYSPAKLEIMQDLIDVHLGQQGLTKPVVDMLNAKYLIVPAGQNGEGAVYPNPDACGNAWFVAEAKMVPTADAEILALKGAKLGDTVLMQNGFNPKTTAVIRNEFQKELAGYTFGKDSAASVKLTKYGLNDLSFQSRNAQNGLAVFSDIWYKYGWEATIDGKPASIIRANYVLRALKIPAGNHVIEFHFRPASFARGETFSMMGSLAVLLICAAAIGYGFTQYRRRKSTTSSVSS